MNLANISKPTACPQCGEDWSKRAVFEFCPRCGSPVARFSFDPLRTTIFGGLTRVNIRAKLIVRSGVFGLGMLMVLTGMILVYGGWLSSSGMDSIQLWISRFSGPVLLVQGFIYAWLPFRKAAMAKIIAFPIDRARRLQR